MFSKELQYIEILDDYTEAHYDLVFGKFSFDSAHFIHNEARDILLVSFPLEETLSAERAGEFVTCIWCRLLQVSWHNESLKDDEKEQGCCTPSVLAVAMIPTKKIFVE